MDMINFTRLCPVEGSVKKSDELIDLVVILLNTRNNNNNFGGVFVQDLTHFADVDVADSTRVT